MYMLIRYPVGIIVEAVVLAKGRDRMRVAAAGFPDTIELRRSGSQWFTSAREPIEFEFLMPDPRQRKKQRETPHWGSRYERHKKAHSPTESFEQPQWKTGGGSGGI
jgi:hypothetical protein